jgi:hypothetical protein
MVSVTAVTLAYPGLEPLSHSAHAANMCNSEYPLAFEAGAASHQVWLVQPKARWHLVEGNPW